MAQPKLFVSHSSKDTDFAERLVNDLRGAGANAWLDKEDLAAGNFQQRISEALEGCEWFVLALTRNALESPWVRQEVDAANRLKNQGQIRELIFVKAGPVEHHELPALWGVFNVFDATTDYRAAVDRVTRAIGLSVSSPRVVQRSLDPDSPRSAEAAPAQREATKTAASALRSRIGCYTLELLVAGATIGNVLVWIYDRALIWWAVGAAALVLAVLGGVIFMERR